MKRSIQSKIFLAFLLVISFALVCITSVWYIRSSNTMKINATNYAIDNIQRANENLEMMLENIDNISAVIATNKLNVINVLQKTYKTPTYQWFNELTEIKEFLGALMVYEQMNISGITVIGMNGNTYIAGNTYIPKNILEEEWVKKMVELQGKKVIVKRNLGVNRYNEDSIDIITFGRAIMDNGKPIGIILVDMEYDVIKKNFDINYLEDSFIFLADTNGDFIYHSDESMSNGNIQNTPYYEVYKNSTLQDKKYIYVYYQSSYTGWTTVGMISKTALEKDVISIRNQTISTSVLIFIIALFVSVIVSNQITKNLKRLRDTMKLVEQGDLMAIPQIRSKDEVGELSKSFTGMMAEIHSLMENIKKQEKAKREIELKALQATVSPHFLYNTLNTIKYLADGQNVRNISEVTTSLINLLRITVGKGKEFITIQEEIDHVKSYLNIQEYKYLDKFSVIFQIEEEVLRYKTIKMILQPVVENALIHGIEPSEYPGAISIKIYRAENIIKFKVTDNGVGMSEEQIRQALEGQDNKHKSRFSGIGINNVNERIQLFFGDPYGLKVYSELGLYTTVEIQIPILEEEVEESA